MYARLIVKSLASLLLSSSAWTVAASGVPQLVTPDVVVNGESIAAGAFDCGLTGAATVCTANHVSGTGYSLDHVSLVLNADPKITSTFTLTNLSPVAQGFALTITLAIVPVGPPVAISGYAGPSTLTDTAGDGATAHDTGSALYSAMIDGATVHTLLDPPWSFSIPANPFGGGGGTLTIPMASYGPTSLAQAALSSIGIKWNFNLTGSDTFSSTGHVEVAAVPVPPGVWLLMPILPLMVRRRCSA